MTINISTRIRRALLGLAIVLCVLFSGLTLVLVYVVEDKIFIDQLLSEQRSFRNSGYSRSWQPKNGSIRKLNSATELPKNLPKELRDIIIHKKGVHEYFDSTRAFFIAHNIKNSVDDSYFLMYDVSDFLAVRNTKTTLVSLIGITTLLILGIALIVARYLSKATLTPLRRLTKALQEQEIDDVVISMANQFSPDEVGILTRELALALERARDAAQREYEFNRGVSHELRTPIQAAQSATELLSLSAEQHNATQQKYLDRLNRAMNEMNQIVEAFLWLSGGYSQSKAKSCSIEHLLERLQKSTQLKIFIDSEIDKQYVYLIPESVLLIILRSLIKNATTYGSEQDISGIGLTIVKRLCEYFEYTLTINNQENTFFSVEIYENAKGLKPK